MLGIRFVDITDFLVQLWNVKAIGFAGSSYPEPENLIK